MPGLNLDVHKDIVIIFDIQFFSLIPEFVIWHLLQYPHCHPFLLPQSKQQPHQLRQILDQFLQQTVSLFLSVRMLYYHNEVVIFS